MQELKDSFYVALRDRLAVVNAARTVVVRGQTRPAVVVDENESLSEGVDDGVFHLQWKDAEVLHGDSIPLRMLTCAIEYRSRGGAQLNGLARGRELSAMDDELSAMLTPQSTALQQYSASGVMDLNTRVFWCETNERTLKQSADGLLRMATVCVMAYGGAA